MTQRLNPFKAAPEAVKAMMAVEQQIGAGSLEPALLELLRMRVSQINGCAFCLHLHASDARRAGESEMRLYLLDAWRESSLYSERERAALAWAETLTLVAERRAPDAVYQQVRAQFDETEVALLTLAVGAINLWNRLQIGVGASHPASARRAAA